jgi:acetate---CoA ligase (ADP-forming)
MDTSLIMKKFVEPQSIAIVGATRKTGEFSMNIVEHILSYGYSGKLYPINPNATEIAGIKAFAAVADIAGPVDLAVVVTPRGTVPGVLRELAAKGIMAAIIVGQGFTDAGDAEGKELNSQLQQVIRTTGIRVLGPNTFGVANAFINFSSSFARIVLDKNPVGIICQSGTFFHGYPEFRLAGKCIDVGNACDIGFTEGLEYYENDPQVKVIGLHIEGMKETTRFLDTLRRVASRKPVIVLKTGRSEQAARAMQSHTGSLAGNSALWDIALKRAGAIRVSGLEELFDTVRLFTIAPLMKNNKIAVASYSGAAGIMIMDALLGSGLNIGRLLHTTASKLQAMSPSWFHVSNPVDYWPIMMGHPDQGLAMRDIMDVLLSDEDLGGVIYVQVAFTEAFGEGTRMFLNYLADKHPGKPFVSAIPGIYSIKCISGLQQDGKHPAYPSPERAARALAHLWEYSRTKLLPE